MAVSSNIKDNHFNLKDNQFKQIKMKIRTQIELNLNI